MLTSTWTYRPLDLGRSAFEHKLAGVPISLEVADGGGRVPTLAIWRIAKRAVVIVEAGQA